MTNLGTKHICKGVFSWYWLGNQRIIQLENWFVVFNINNNSKDSLIFYYFDEGEHVFSMHVLYWKSIDVSKVLIL